MACLEKYWWRRWLAFWVVIVASQAALAAGQANTTVLVLGDSLSAAYGLPSEQGWVRLLQDRLRQIDKRYRVVNASISGETTAGGRARLTRSLRQHAPALVIIALGANDGLRGTPPSAIEENLLAMARAVAAQNSKLIIVGMRLPPNYGARYDEQFRAVFTNTARQYASAFVPFLLADFGDKPEMFQQDGLHPTAAAQHLILENIWPSVRRVLQRH